MTEQQKRRMNDLLEANRQRELEPDEVAPAAATVLTDDQILEAVVHVDPLHYGLPKDGPDYIGYDLACARLVEAEVLANASKGAASAKGELPAILFDSMAVLKEVIAKRGTAIPEAVADTLDAVVRLMRKGGNTSDNGSSDLAQAGVRAEPADLGHVLRTLRSMLDGSQPKDTAGAVMVIDNALKNGIAWSYDIAPPQGFVSYVKANYYGDVHFHDPEWHATRLWNAAMKNAGARIPTTPAQVPAAEVRAQALEMARSYIEAMSAEPGYGFARPANPHDFCPDAECCSADEIAAHKAACEAYDKGEYTPERGSEWVGAMHILRAPWGIGSYTMRDEQAVKVLAAIDSALAQSSTADKAGEVRAAEWISVDERMPEYGQTVIALYWPYNKRTNPQAVTSAEYINGEFFLNDGERMHYPSHWMPIPDAPSTADSGNTGALGEGASE